MNPTLRYAPADLPGPLTTRAVNALSPVLTPMAMWHVQGTGTSALEWRPTETETFRQKFEACGEMVIDREDNLMAQAQKGGAISLNNLAKCHADFVQRVQKPVAIYGLPIRWESVTSPPPLNHLKAMDAINAKFDSLVPFWLAGCYVAHDTAEAARTYGRQMAELVSQRTDKPVLLLIAPWGNHGPLAGKAVPDSITTATIQGGIEGGARGVYVWDHHCDSWHKGTSRWQQIKNAERDAQLSRTLRLAARELASSGVV